LTSLRYLDVSLNAAFDDDVTPWLANLTGLMALKINGSGVEDTGLLALECNHILLFLLIFFIALTNLTTIDLSRCAFTDIACDGKVLMVIAFGNFIFTALIQMKKLNTLSMSYTKISDAGALKLSKMPCLLSLKFNFCSNLTDVGISYLASLKPLRTLSIGSKHITNAAIEHITKLANLETLELWETSMNEEGVQNLTNILKYLGKRDERMASTSAGTFIFKDEEPFSPF